MDASVSLDRFPVSGETVMGNSVSFVPGGKGANQAAAAGRLAETCKVAMGGCVGDDSFGPVLIEDLRKSGVDVSAVTTVHGCSTGFAVVSVDAEGSNEIVVIPGSNAKCDDAYIQSIDNRIMAADYVVFQLETPIPAVYRAIRHAKELGKTVVLNPAPAPDAIPDDVLKLVDYLTPNETELMRISGRTGNNLSDYEAAAKALVARGVANLVVTLGSQGALLVNREECVVIPGFPVKAVDTVAAGDCFNGAMAVALAQGSELKDAIRFANKAASIAVSRKGAQDSLPFRNELSLQD